MASRSAIAEGPARRLRRLLAILAHLASVGEAGIEDLARRFDMQPDEMVAELELAACCGLPPYTPDQLIELIVDADTVVAEKVGGLGRPPRLTPAEGFAIAAAARALMAVPGADPEGTLAGALAKLDAALGEDRLVLDIEAPEHLAALRSAVAGRRRVEIDYVSVSGGTRSLRLVDPYQVVLREGRWYLDGYCHKADGVRRFGVERVQAVTETGDDAVVPDELTPDLEDPRAFVGGAEATPATLALPHRSVWMVERVAVGDRRQLDDGRIEVTVAVGSDRWLEQLMLRLGPGAEVTAPPRLVGAQARAARRALQQYRKS